MTDPDENRECPLCGAAASRASLAYRSGEFRIVQCPDCDLAFLHRLPPQHEFAEERAWEVSSASHATERERKYPLLVALDRVTRYRLHLFTKRVPKTVLARFVPPGPFVEPGCAAGVNLIPPPDGFIPFGIEISKSLAAAADLGLRPYGGKCLQAPAIEGLAHFPPRYFHGALLVGYLEHEFHPREVLSRLRDKLVDKAAVIVKVPNYASLNRRIMGLRWSGFRFPDHVNYFTPRTLADMARRAGFSIHYGPTDRNPLSDSLWGVLRAV